MSNWWVIGMTGSVLCALGSISFMCLYLRQTIPAMLRRRPLRKAVRRGGAAPEGEDSPAPGEGEVGKTCALRLARDGRLLHAAGAAGMFDNVLDGSREEPTSLGDLAKRLAAGGRELERGARRLVAEGVEFEAVVETPAGRLVAVTGAVDGADAVLTLSDQTRLRKAMAATEARAMTAERELATMAAAQSAAGLIAWRAPLGADAPAEPVWRSEGFGRLDPAVRGELSRVASAARAAPGGRARAVIRKTGESEGETAGADEARDEAAYDVVAVDAPRAPAEHEDRADAPTREALFIARDAGRKRAAEAALEGLVHNMSEAFAHLRVGLMIFDADRRLALFNPAVSRLLDGDASWLARRPGFAEVLNRMRKARALPEQADYASWRARMLERAAGPESAPIEELWHAPDGRSLTVSLRPHASGGFAFLIEDITESLSLRRISVSERAVRRATTDMLAEGVVVFGVDGRVRMANDAFRAIWRIPEETPTEGDHVSGLVARCEAMTGPDVFWETLKGVAVGGSEGAGRSASVDALTLNDGRFLSARISPMPDGSTLALFSDVTASEKIALALKERNGALEQAEEMRAALVDRISHQMRTPLNSISGFGQLLEEPRVGPLNDVQRDYVRGIVESSAELLDAIDGMTDLIALEAGALNETALAFDPVRVLHEVVTLAEIRFQRRRCRIFATSDEPGGAEQTGGDAPGWRFVGHRTRLRQIAFNMLVDALSRIAEGGCVRFAIARRHDGLSLTCDYRDDGEEAGEASETGAEAGEAPLSRALAFSRRFARLTGGDLTVGRDADDLRRVVCVLPNGGDEAEAEPTLPAEAASAPSEDEDDETQFRRAPLARAAGSR